MFLWNLCDSCVTFDNVTLRSFRGKQFLVLFNCYNKTLPPTVPALQNIVRDINKKLNKKVQKAGITPRHVSCVVVLFHLRKLIKGLDKKGGLHNVGVKWHILGDKNLSFYH